MIDAGLVTLDVWRVPRRRIVRALWRVAHDRDRLRRSPGVRFAKVLGTGRGRDFRAGHADLRRWAALTVWDAQPRSTAVHRRWHAIAAAWCRLTLRPLTSRGRWAGQAPFGPRHPTVHNGPVVVVTRARLRPSAAIAFWRAIGPVAATVSDAPGLQAALGVGEAPLLFQGTVSVWAGAADIGEFAYRTAEHTRVVRQTSLRRWYTEELFARLAVLSVEGDPDVIGWDRLEDAG